MKMDLHPSQNLHPNQDLIHKNVFHKVFIDSFEMYKNA